VGALDVPGKHTRLVVCAPRCGHASHRRRSPDPCQCHFDLVSAGDTAATTAALATPRLAHAALRVTGSNILPSVHPSWAVSKASSARYNGLAGCRRRTHASACRASWHRQGQPRCLACNSPSPRVLFAYYHTTDILIVEIQQHATLAKRHPESTTERRERASHVQPGWREDDVRRGI